MVLGFTGELIELKKKDPTKIEQHKSEIQALKEMIVRNSKGKRIDEMNLERHFSAYQLSSREHMGSRITKATAKNQLTTEVILNYIKRMQDFDAIFTKIKTHESCDDMDEITKEFDRVNDKINDAVIKKTDLDNEINNYSVRISQGKDFILDTLGLSTQFNEREKATILSNLSHVASLEQLLTR